MMKQYDASFTEVALRIDYFINVLNKSPPSNSQLDEIMDYYDNKTNETNKDSVMQVMHERSGVLVKKQLEFVKETI